MKAWLLEVCVWHLFTEGTHGPCLQLNMSPSEEEGRLAQHNDLFIAMSSLKKGLAKIKNVCQFQFPIQLFLFNFNFLYQCLKVNTKLKKLSLLNFVACLNYWLFPQASLGDINQQVKTNH